MQTRQPIPARNFEQQMAIFKIVWVALLATVVMHAYILYMQTQQFEPVALQGDFKMQMSMAAFFVAAAAFLVPRWIGKTISKRPATSPQMLVQRALMPFIVRLALIDAVSVFGFLIGFMSKEFHHFLPFGAAAVVLYGLSFPTLTNLQRICGFRMALEMPK